MHKSEILFYALIAFICGVFVASFVYLNQSLVLILIIFAIGFIAISGYQRIYRRRGILFGALLLIFVFGVVRFNSFNFSNSILTRFADVEAAGKGVPVNLRGYINEEPDIKGDKSQFIFRVKELIVPDKSLELNERVLVKTNAFPKYKFGDLLLINGVLRRPQNISEDFDYITYLKKQNIQTMMSFPRIVEKDYDIMIYHNLGFFERAEISLHRKIFGLKGKFEEAINKSVAEPNASYINGILLGSRQDIPDKIKEAFKRTGTTHILAISGYNIMIISWAILELLVYLSRRRTAFWISVLVIILFTILTGASSSVVRASIMGLLLLFAHGYGRLYDSKNSIIFVGAVMIFLNPFALVFDVGFQLSFLAVIGLLYVYPFLDSKLKGIPELWKLKELTLMTISAQVVVLPLLIYYFHQFSPLSLPVNILVLPFVPYAMLLGVFTGLAGMANHLVGNIIGYAAWAITTYQIKVIEFFAAL